MSSLYRPLDAHRHEIRLLNLLPESSGGFDSPIHCTLLYSYIDSPSLPPYEALTYFWGDKAETRPITLDSHPVSITANLELALRHLRLPTSPRILWVDALCINQDDTAERSHQVGLMRDVYQRCTRDIAWLGPLSDGEEFAPDYLSPDNNRIKWADHVRDGMALMRCMRLRDLEHVSLEGNPGLDSMASGEDYHNLKYRQAHSLRSVFERPRVWSRVWVMQELSCAAEVTLVYAREEMGWDVVSEFLDNRVYADAFHMPHSHGSSSPVTEFMTAALAIEHQRGIMREGYRASLLDVLARFKNVFSTDPRDRVYGLLGLVTEEHGLRVDYGRAAGDVFAEVAVYLINSLGNLDIICQNPWAKDKRTPGLASWVPDFADEEYSNRDARTGFARMLFAQRSIFAAGREKCETPVGVVRGEDGGWKIRARGAVIGKLGRVLHDECHDEEVHEKTYGPMILPRKWMLLYFGTELLDAPEESGKLEAFWRTLVMDCEAYPIVRLGDDVVEEIRPDWEFHLRYDGPEDPDEAREEDQEKLREWWWMFGRGRQMWYRNREEWTFCLSDNGLYLMVRRGAREGDLIAVLDGGKVPVILRGVPGEGDGQTEYAVVCAAYVHGFMDGKAVEMCEAGLLTEQEFLIA